MRKDWYLVSDKEGAASYLELSAMAAFHMESDGYDVHLVEPPIMRQRKPGQHKPATWREVRVWRNLRGRDDCVVSYANADFLYRDITEWSCKRLFDLAYSCDSYWDGPADSFGFAYGGAR